MSWSEGEIAAAIARQTLARRCVVLVDRCNWTGHECDLLGVTADLRIIDVEIKVSRADLKADADKNKWWRRLSREWGKPMPAPIAREHPPKVWKHYYALPASIWKPELVDCLPSRASGVLLVERTQPKWGVPHVSVRCERRAKPAADAYRLTAAQAVDIARLANLRMWDAYGRRDGLQDEVRHWRDAARAATGDLMWRVVQA